ncbi:MAG: DNA primase [Parcubacteria group bacterium CG08_land_8_20_14_0_20_43_9]|nr:MAG: DNA primase [Parcubacteria group bacterium CG08_land_8_20_14_0_20_43_9]
MDSVISEIKEKLDIVDVVSSYIKLEKTGINYRALCPFHSEKKPSFFVSPTRQIWSCFGCGLKGDIFAFVKEIEGVEFGDALRILAKRAGVELRSQDPKVQTARKRIYDICELATKFFEKQLHLSSTGGKAKEYLLKRGLNKESIMKWRIGFAPDLWDSLMKFLQEKGYSIGEIKRAGLILESEKGKVYDRFRSRIIFPIFDLNSQVIGFGGRVFGKDEAQETAKYLNIPNTVLYNKSQVLYGLNQAKIPIRKNDGCILVEGYTDVIMSHQAGVQNAVATSGTALTPLQLSVLKRYSNNLITAFDMDIAGDSATKRGIDLAQAQGFNIKVAVLPDVKDPAEMIAEDPEAWKKFVSEARSIVEFYFNSAFSRFDAKSHDGKRKISEKLIPALKRLQNKIEQSSWVKELANRLMVSEASVEEELKKYVPSAALIAEAPKEIRGQEVKKTRKDIIEERILSLLLNYPDGFAHLEDRHFGYFSPRIKEMIVKIGEIESKNFKEADFSDEDKEFLDFSALKGEVEAEMEAVEKGTGIAEEIQVCLKELESLTIKRELEELSDKIRIAEQEGEKDEVEKLCKEFRCLTESLSGGHNDSRISKHQ